MRLYSAWILLVLAAPPCQENNPEFDGQQESGSTSGTSSTTNPETDAGPDSADSTTTAVATMGATGSTGQPPDTMGSSSSSESTTDEASGTTAGCPMPMMMCGDLCVDIQTDNDHCGECDNGCNPVQQCVGGRCMMK